MYIMSFSTGTPQNSSFDEMGSLLASAEVPVTPAALTQVSIHPGEHEPVTPIAPEGGRPVYPNPGGHEPVTPIAPEGGRPVYPNPGGHEPVTPIAPEGGRPVYPNPGGHEPVIPGYSCYPVAAPNMNSCRIRFFNAASGFQALRISVAGRMRVPLLPYGSLSCYQIVRSGMQRVTITVESSRRPVLLRRNLALQGSKTFTICIIPARGGIDLLQIPDTPCTYAREGLACFRILNLSYDSLPLDLKLANGDTLFSGIGFGDLSETSIMQPGRHLFYLTPTGIPGSVAPEEEVLGSISVGMEAGRFYTLFLLGEQNSITPHFSIIMVDEGPDNF